MNKLIEVTPKVFVPDCTSYNPYEGETVSMGTILINTDYIKIIEGNCIVISIDGQDRFYSVFETYEEIKGLISGVRKESNNE
ncbi:hypothetical protein [Sphingobacterium thalpophilum]|uniref:hypothetical protein n=1 Tax=Sphingobacterium thalpophilum TaxID=259 RepID=UPI003D98A3E4